MKKLTAPVRLFTVFLSVLCLSGCAPSKGHTETPPEQPLRYSNLLDTDSQDEVYGALEAAGVAEDTLTVLDGLVEQYNERMTVFSESDLAYMDSEADFFDYQEGFVETSEAFIDYGSYYNHMKKWYAAGDDDDILCRTLAFLLMQENISVSQCLPQEQWACENEDAYLYSDQEVFAENSHFALSRQAQAVYFTLFHPVQTDGPISQQSMAQTIQSQWEEHGVRFSDGSLSMVSIWTEHGGIIHNSHAGVLVDNGAELLLVEKTNPLFPYQATKFVSREQLKQYMVQTLTAGFQADGLDVPPMTVLENERML